ncbi:hypothetical protein [Saccharopolyspora mangrovi]|uniref:Uncharacterized protein n=1 Tax=Saccharopolyspora mangrovi TaxID=3082379 RepID=A0ABU6A734_9PSEU|nr:hypothetical protein [Saccharopolyspora sp. S2-29]MEB3367374.1 hypothetical protein [Saccharopolyspora sp. S2-29]
MPAPTDRDFVNLSRQQFESLKLGDRLVRCGPPELAERYTLVEKGDDFYTLWDHRMRTGGEFPQWWVAQNLLMETEEEENDHGN